MDRPQQDQSRLLGQFYKVFLQVQAVKVACRDPGGYTGLGAGDGWAVEGGVWVKFKIFMYIISLWLLFVLIILKEFRIFWDECKGIGDRILDMILGNPLSLILMGFLFVSFVFYKWVQFQWRGGIEVPVTIKTIENQNFEQLTFLTTYIIPFIGVNQYDTRSIYVTSFVIIIIGAIFVKTNLYYANPTLSLLGYHLYKADDINGKSYLFISKSIMKAGDIVDMFSIDEKVKVATVHKKRI